MAQHQSGRASHPLGITRTLAFALAATATSALTALSLPASAFAGVQATSVVSAHGLADAKVVKANNRSFPVGMDDDNAVAIDSAFQGDPEDEERPPTKFVGVIREHKVFIRDPRTTPRWHDLSSRLPRNFGHLVDITLAAPDEGTTVHVTVLNAHSRIAQSTCTVFPPPGTMATRPWPANCSPFADITPPA
ncbi:hypothetical protein [Nonomuraea sp. NPDC005692]|uniref:hypothetical protein n=1 Tax=Nonomuraea sp. NPDC005692 TaxID=3157168 RepID=UPI00340D4D8A